VFGKVDSFMELCDKINGISSKMLIDVANQILYFDKMSHLMYY